MARELGRRLKVGYVSPDFRQLSVAYFVDPLLKGHDQQAVEVFRYAEVVRSDADTGNQRMEGLNCGERLAAFFRVREGRGFFEGFLVLGPPW